MWEVRKMEGDHCGGHTGSAFYISFSSTRKVVELVSRGAVGGERRQDYNEGLG